LCQPLFVRVERGLRGRTRWAAGLTTAAGLGLLLVPLSLGVTIAAIELIGFAQHSLSEPGVNLRAEPGEVHEWRVVPGTAVRLDGDPAALQEWREGDGVRITPRRDMAAVAGRIEAFRGRPAGQASGRPQAVDTGTVAARGSRWTRAAQ